MGTTYTLSGDTGTLIPDALLTSTHARVQAGSTAAGGRPGAEGAMVAVPLDWAGMRRVARDARTPARSSPPATQAAKPSGARRAHARQGHA